MVDRLSAAEPETLAQLVVFVRGEKVMLDADLALLYGVSTGALNRAEWENLRCQIGIS
jgi:hypothetical protein